MRQMMRASFVFACAALAASPALAQKADVKAEVMNDWAAMKAAMVKITAEMPEDKFGYKSTPAQRNYGEQALHVAFANLNFLKTLGGKTPAPVVDLKATSKAAIITGLEASFDYGTAVLNEQTADSMLEQIKVPPFMGGLSSRARVVNFLIGHAWDTYGQMAVYLRLNGHVPPASQRP